MSDFVCSYRKRRGSKHYNQTPNITLHYSSPGECPKFSKSPTNPRYFRSFFQTHFTAGDESQFITASGVKEGKTLNTFRYLFYKFKKGVYVRIEGGKVAVFLPFSNARFENEWSDRIEMPDMDFFRHICEGDGFAFREHKVNKDKSKWYSNNALLRYEWPINEGDTGIPTWHDMLNYLCENKHIHDCEFFLNRRDFPLLTKDRTEPYDHIWDTESLPLISHKYPSYTPIFSVCNSDRFDDLLMPTPDDWARVCATQLKPPRYFSRSRLPQGLSECAKIPWKVRKPVAVFRGSSTGVGVSVETNPRLHLASIVSPILDAGITKWCLRPRKVKGCSHLVTQDPNLFPFSLKTPLTTVEQAHYKYIVNVDGHVAASRLGAELATGSVILKVRSEWKLWFSDMLEPYVHYVPIKADLSDLIEQIEWCIANDDQCEKIAENALQFYDKHLSEEGLLEALQRMFF